jgi:hypothetical protein
MSATQQTTLGGTLFESDDEESNNPKSYTAINAREGNQSNGVVARGTARRDTVAKILRNGWVNGAVCDGRYTDDYKRDEARNYDKGPVPVDAILSAMDRTNPRNCWIKQMADGRQLIVVSWGFMSYIVSLDKRNVIFTFDIDDDSENDEQADDPEPQGTPGDVFEQLSTGDTITWDGKKQPLTITVGYDDAIETREEQLSEDEIAEMDIPPTLWVEGPRGGEKMLNRSTDNPDVVTVSTMSMSSRPETVSGLRIIDE